MEFRKMVMRTLDAKQKKRHRCTEQTFGLCGRRQGWDVSREQHRHMFIIYRVFSNESVLCIRWPRIVASASVLPMNIQDWFPLGLSGLISLQSKGLSRVFSNTAVQKHQFFGAPYGPNFTSMHDYWKSHSFD